MSIEKFINDFEETHQVWDWKIGHIQIWPYIKMKLHVYIHKSPTVSHKLSIFNLISVLFVSSFKWMKFRRVQSDILFSTNIIYHTYLNGKLFDKFCDPLIDELNCLGKTHSVIEYGQQSTLGEIRITGNKILQMQPFILAISLFSKIFKKKYIYRLEGYEDFLKELQTRFPSSISFKKKLGIQQLLYNFHLLNLRKWLLKDLLIRKKVRICFNICFYDDKGIALSMACNELGLECVDIQHGLQQYPHLAYNGWKKEKVHNHIMFPTHFWCWDIISFNNLQKWKRLDNLILGGNPWFDFWRLNNVTKADSNLRKSIVYSMQPVSDPFPPDLIALINATEKDFQWVIRLHPSQFNSLDNINDQLKFLGIYDKVVVHTHHSLFETLLDSVLHITKWSTVVIEAAYFNVPTIFLDLKGMIYFKDIVDKNLLIFEQDLITSYTMFQNRSFSIDNFSNIENIQYREALKFLLDE